ncbi:glutelin type-A 3-like [Phragmites australis]|uniref:glutelin type-A 3-like n=1 Tax=Phragmites australis TaxID=29695 RepID=UPI002D77EF48|nr:glutelin type-A 3-like [Phragmites australis]
MRVRRNIDNPNLANTYNLRARRITHLNSQKFPILNLIQMSAVKVNLYQDALLSPFWNINAHSVVYITQGCARVQVVNNRGKIVFNGELHRGQLLIIPQYHVVLKKAQREGCAYIAFKTNPNSMVSHIVGKSSIFCDLPNDVIATAYRISREEARRLKNNRGNEFGAFTPSHSYRSYQDVVWRWRWGREVTTCGDSDGVTAMGRWRWVDGDGSWLRVEDDGDDGP